MKVKIMEGEGPFPPKPGIWYNMERDTSTADRDFYRKKVERTVQELRPMDENNPDFDSDYAYMVPDFIRWKDWSMQRWLEDHWGTEKYREDTQWVGVVYEPEPEFNEFGEVSP